jgi:hypothetical protein
VDIELLHIDDCPSWIESESRLIDALSRVGAAGVSIKVVTMTDAAQAAAANFAGSPTILVDGVDLFPGGSQSSGLACRVYRTPAGLSGLPTTEQIVEALAAR